MLINSMQFGVTVRFVFEFFFVNISKSYVNNKIYKSKKFRAMVFSENFSRLFDPILVNSNDCSFTGKLSLAIFKKISN